MLPKIRVLLIKMLKINPRERLELSCDKDIRIIENILKKKFVDLYETDWLNILMAILNEIQPMKFLKTHCKLALVLKVWKIN